MPMSNLSYVIIMLKGLHNTRPHTLSHTRSSFIRCSFTPKLSNQEERNWWSTYTRAMSVCVCVRDLREGVVLRNLKNPLIPHRQCDSIAILCISLFKFFLQLYEMCRVSSAPCVKAAADVFNIILYIPAKISCQIVPLWGACIAEKCFFFAWTLVEVCDLLVHFYFWL